MEAALVSVSMGVMKPLLFKLTKLLEEEYVKVKGVRKQISFLRDELGAMSATLQMLWDAEHLNSETREWRDKLRELAYDLEDCVDAFTLRVDHDPEDGLSAFERFFCKLKKLKACHAISNQVEELKTRAIVASERHKRYNFVQPEPAQDSSASSIDPRLPALYEEIEKLVGLDGPKKHIIERLSMVTKSSSMEVKVVSIYGCGGIGKTTLANQVYHAIERQFSCASFVSVSRTPNMTKILRDVARGVGFTDYTLDDDVEQLINKLRMHLHDKRYLVVVDDIWDAKAWDIIHLALLNNHNGSKIITTTRSAKVASRCSSQGGYVYQMEALSFADSKRLFSTRAFGYEELCYPHLEQVFHRILEKCGGLPLALITISSLLVDQLEIDEWTRVLNAIGRALAKDPDAEDMTKILSLSYFDLPHHLRTCFLYLSVFPEDHLITKQRLINRWIAEGFIHEEQGRRAYETGEYYFNDLINRSLIQPVDVEYGQATACKVHDIILDYIKCKASEENFVTSLDAAEDRYISEYKIRRLCFANRNEQDVTMLRSHILSHVRTLTVTVINLKQSSLLNNFTALRVLDLEDYLYSYNYDLACIDKLCHLKYLRLSSNSITNLTGEIGELKCLETLDIQGTKIEEMPPTITKLQRLAHLYIDSATRFPEGTIGQMHNLEELWQYGVKSYKQGKTLQELTKLTKLRTFKIEWIIDWSDDSDRISHAYEIQCHLGTLVSSCNLQNLYVRDSSKGFHLLSLDSWCPAASCTLRKLHIDECFVCHVPIWMGSLGNLGVLELSIVYIRPEDVEILGSLPTLLFLKLATYGGTDERIIVHGSHGFRSLKYFSLFVAACGTTLEFEAGSMPRVEHLKLKFIVFQMECANGASDFGIHHLSTLTKVEVIIIVNYDAESNHNPKEYSKGCTSQCFASGIKTSLETLPSHPTFSFKTMAWHGCGHFECVIFSEKCRLLHHSLGIGGGPFHPRLGPSEASIPPRSIGAKMSSTAALAQGKQGARTDTAPAQPTPGEPNTVQCPCM
ncbi:unnamed protein product [Urochloa humidicola]